MTLVRYEGEAVAGDWPLLGGLHYGDGVFRTVLCWQGRLVDAQRQYRKLAADAAALDLEAPAAADFDADLRELLRESPAAGAVVKLLVCRAPASRGYAPQTRRSRRIVTLSDLPAYEAECWRSGIAAGIADLRLSRQPRLAGIKHLNRLEQVLASRGWPGHWREALLCDDRDNLVCGTRTNVFLLMQERLVTPDLSSSGVAGAMREKVLELAAALGLSCELRPVARRELERAEECFVTNSLIGLWPVRQLDGRALPAPGPLSGELARRLDHPWKGQL